MREIPYSASEPGSTWSHCAWVRGFLGPVPFVEHQRRDPLELGILVRRADVACQLEPVAVGVEEIDRAENAVEGRSEHVDPLGLDMRLGGVERVEVGDFEGDMLDPFGGVGIAAHLGLVGQLEESDDIAAAAIEEDVHVGVVGAGRGDMILGEGIGVAHAEDSARTSRPSASHPCSDRRRGGCAGARRDGSCAGDRPLRRQVQTRVSRTSKGRPLAGPPSL